jgi:tetratricopeptide (TPR) repeat protein
VYLLSILAIAVSSFSVGPRPSWSQSNEVLEAESHFQRGVANTTVNPGEAESAFKEALTRYSRIAKEVPGEPNFRINMGAASLNLALIAQRSNRFGEAEEWFRKSASIYEALAAEPRSAQEGNKRLAVARAARAILLSTCPYPRIRNTAEAIWLAQSSTELDRSNPECWITLGVVEINSGHPPAAIGAIEKAMSLRNGGDARDWFVMAEAYTVAGDRQEAIRWFEKASSWMAANRPGDQQLKALRAEAASLLGRAN